MAYKPDKHGRDHCPGGEDPIPCLGNPWVRRSLTSDEPISSGGNDALIGWDVTTFDDFGADYFTATGGTTTRVEKDGLYEITAELVWDSSKVEGSVVTLNSNSLPGFTWNKGWYDAQNAGHTIEHNQTFTYVRRLEKGTVLRLFVVHFAAVTRTLQGHVDSTDTYMEIRYKGGWTGDPPVD